MKGRMKFMKSSNKNLKKDKMRVCTLMGQRRF